MTRDERYKVQVDSSKIVSNISIFVFITIWYIPVVDWNFSSRDLCRDTRGLTVRYIRLRRRRRESVGLLSATLSDIQTPLEGSYKTRDTPLDPDCADGNGGS